jgi:hypothetical protein
MPPYHSARGGLNPTAVFIQLDLFIKYSSHWKCIDNLPIKLVTNNNNSVASVREGSIPTEQPPIVVDVSANFCG